MYVFLSHCFSYAFCQSVKQESLKVIYRNSQLVRSVRPQFSYLARQLASQSVNQSVSLSVIWSVSQSINQAELCYQSIHLSVSQTVCLFVSYSASQLVKKSVCQLVSNRACRSFFTIIRFHLLVMAVTIKLA